MEDVPHLVAKDGGGIAVVVLFADDDGMHPTERRHVACVAIEGDAVFFVRPQNTTANLVVEQCDLHALDEECRQHAHDIQVCSKCPTIDGEPRVGCRCRDRRISFNAHHDGAAHFDKAVSQVVVDGVISPCPFVHIKQGKHQRKYHDGEQHQTIEAEEGLPAEQQSEPACDFRNRLNQ